MDKKTAIAIDGPAGAGKSTIARMLAEKLGIVYIDTGAMYRAVALEAVRRGIDTKDRKKLEEMVREVDISIKLTGQGQAVFLGKENVNHLIRTPEISIGSSNVAAVPEVRKKMVELQREIAGTNSIVMDGRDIGTRVIPDAGLKIFLTASVEERAKRRYKELNEAGNTSVTLQEVEDDIRYRDLNDMTRDCDPLRPADDAKILDTTGIPVEQVVELIMEELYKLMED